MIDHMRNHPAVTGTFGSGFGWLSFDLLRASENAAALLAAAVSAGTLVIIAPKIMDAIMALPEKWRKFRAWMRGDKNL
jgi:hypothetical protein